MTLHYSVGIRIDRKAGQVTVEAEDALIAALKVKTTHPEAAITYVRKQNARGDRRNPHAGEGTGLDPSLAAAAALNPGR